MGSIASLYCLIYREQREWVKRIERFNIYTVEKNERKKTEKNNAQQASFG
jgi:hypothetical protein